MDKMREEFEAWAKSDGYDLSKYTKGGLEGFYSNSVTGSAWLGWKASRAALRVELPQDISGEYYADGWNSALASVEVRLRE